ncbi:MAG TPA: GGDEF domain-containing protein [Methylophilaceae bacterium]|jgi:diguanylate cyclase (GGDEF)-like protein
MNLASPVIDFLPVQADEETSLCAELTEILHAQNLSALFQPIIDIGKASIIGYEGLIRGPSGSVLHSPATLFKTARICNQSTEIEYLSRRVILGAFAKLFGNGKIFLNISPDILLQQGFKTGETLRYIEEIGLSPQQVIIEITENIPTVDYSQLREAVVHYRNMGFEIAIDDLGEGFSGLRLWSELRPDYVKIDQHFIQGINLDPIKRQFVSSIQEIARKSGAKIIAEGIETEAELLIVQEIGIAFGQGYHIARPNAELVLTIPSEVHKALTKGMTEEQTQTHSSVITVERLLRHVAPVKPDCLNDEVYQRFEKSTDLNSIPVVSNERPVGLISRFNMIDRFARPFRRELYGKKTCEMLMDASPLMIEKSVDLHELSDLILQSESHHLAIGFIITDGGKYVGMGSGHDLLRLITTLQIDAARYANPLTLLPGNVPINEHIDGLLDASLPFVACYFDLDHFKPYNDVYGYQKGDEVIQITGRLLKEICDPKLDFLGHVGGDDFIILFQSEDWEQRCDQLLKTFGETAPALYSGNDRKKGGIKSEDRQGKKVFHSILSISIGAVMVEKNQFDSYHQVSSAAAVAKKLAKKVEGNSLFVERRQI